MKAKLEHAFLFTIALEAGKMYMTIFERHNELFMYYVANSLDERPYVYRVLLPFLSRVFHYVFGGNAVTWLGLLFVLSAIGAYFAIKYFYEAFYENKEIAAFVCFQILLLLCLIETKIYDYATAAFSALLLGLLARRKLGVFLILFPIATLNRETTFLLILFCAIWFWRKLPLPKYLTFLACQVVIYGAVKMVVRTAFAGNGGQEIYFELWTVLGMYYQCWPALLVLVPIIYLMVRSWKNAPEFVRVAILTIVPAQIILHLLFGKAFEIRVFAESIMIIAMFFTQYSWLGISESSLDREPSL